MHAPSKYQQAVYDAFTDTDANITISAVAGSGKTTTLLGLLTRIPPGKSAKFMAFNNTIVAELTNRISPKPDNVQISTLHSHGFGLVRARYGNVKVNPNKVFDKLGKAFKKFNIKERERGYYFYMMPKIIDLMRCNLTQPIDEQIIALSCYHDVNVDEQHLPVIRYVFSQMFDDKSQVDFTDMIYWPVVDATIRHYKYDYLLVDESQDMNACQHQLIKRSLKRTGRLVCVGDPNQSIYGFAGADVDSFNRLAELNGDSIRLPLSVSYRCPKAVVEEAQKIVPEISYGPNAEEGIVRDGSLLELCDGDWVLCRNLKPLIETYLWLLKNGIKSKIRGKDIGEGITALINKTGAQTLGRLTDGLQDEQDRLYDQLAKRGVRSPSLHPKMEQLLQRIEVIECLMSEVDDVPQLRTLIENIFSDDIDGILLSTIHKAKGLENDHVFFLLPSLIPSQYATQEWQIRQEENIRYICVTRAKKELVYVHTPQFKNDLSTKI